MNRLNADVEVTADGEYAEHDEVKIVIYNEQADALAEMLRDVSKLPAEYRVFAHELSEAIRIAREG
jgi:hypothetical protein